MNNKNYFYGQQLIDELDIEEICAALRSDFLSQGPKLSEFEDNVAEYCGAKYCVALSNGTAALHLACEVLGLGPEDMGWTSPLSFVASANCMRYCGANVDFIDVDVDTFNISPANVKNKFAQAKKKNVLPKVIMPVHFAGQSCDMDEIKEIADFYGCKVIEDACQSLGGEYLDTKIGACRYSHITVFSLHPVKSITTGEGGLLLTNDEDVYEQVKIMRAHGIVRGDKVNNKSFGPWHAEMRMDGYNYKITDFQCALGISQLKKLDSYVEKRTVLAQRYKDNLKGLPVHFQVASDKATSAWHMFVILIDFEEIGKAKIKVYKELKRRGINLSAHYYPIHLNPFYQELGFGEGMFPNAEGYYKKAFTLPLHPGLELQDIDYVCAQIHGVLS
jgi:UDP-4-amino-4,6-dideoxy-N-acetyl-beta-L-altrosamine transaminase